MFQYSLIKKNPPKLHAYFNIFIFNGLYSFVKVGVKTQRVNIKYICGAIGLMSSVHQWSWRLGFNPRMSHTKDSKNGT